MDFRGEERGLRISSLLHLEPSGLTVLLTRSLAFSIAFLAAQPDPLRGASQADPRIAPS